MKYFGRFFNKDAIMARGSYIDGENVSGGGSGGVTEEFISENYVPFPQNEFGTEISFDSSKIYNTNASAGTGNLTQDLTNAKLGIVQKIYHEDSSEPTFPSEWVLIGNAVYSVNELNIIYAEYVNANRIEYWIVQES